MKKDANGNLVSDDTKLLDMLVTDKADYYPPRLKVCEKFIKNPPTYAPWADRRSRCEYLFKDYYHVTRNDYYWR